MDVQRMVRRREPSLLTMVGLSLWIVLGACTEDGVAPPVDRETSDPVVTSIRVWPCGCPHMDRFGPERKIGVLGTTVRFSAAALAEDGTVLYTSHTDPDQFSWSSSAPDFATVEKSGVTLVLVTGVSEGTATISATSEDVTGEMTVTVREHARPAWALPVGAGWITAGTTVGADGTVYVVNSQYGTTSHLFALSPQGSVLWTVVTPFRVMSTPAIGDDGTLYLASSADGAGRLFAVDPGGTVRWVVEGIYPIRSSPAIGSDGTIYVAGHDHVYAVDPQGEIQWVYETEDRPFAFSSPAIASDGTIYVGGYDSRLHAINPDGSLRWTFRAGDMIASSPSIGVDGTIYFGSLGGRLYAVNPDGSERWSVALNRRTSSSPSIGSDGTIYIGARGVYAIDPGGFVLWHYEPFLTIITTPILGADGTVYVAGTGPSGETVIAALDSQGRLQWDYHTSPAAPPRGHYGGSPAIGADGTIFSTFFSGSSAEGREGIVHATVETGSASGGFEASPWPTERGDRANTGRAGG